MVSLPTGSRLQPAEYKGPECRKHKEEARWLTLRQEQWDIMGLSCTDSA